jgi:hypothetical protein
LAAVNPAAFEPDLVGSLNHLAKLLRTTDVDRVAALAEDARQIMERNGGLG